MFVVDLMEDLTTAHYKISSRSGQVFCSEVICWHLHDMIFSDMYLMSRTSSKNVVPQH